MADAKKALDLIYESVELEVPREKVDIAAYRDPAKLFDHNANERIGAALRVFLQTLAEGADSFDKIDKAVLDRQVAVIDEKISRQLDAILHHPDFQRLESAWRGLKLLVDRADFRRNVKIELLDVSREALEEDFESCPETIQSGLYKHVYSAEYDTPGGQPVSAIVSNYEFTSQAPDIALLGKIAEVSAAAHAPFIGSVGPRFFNKKDARDLASIEDLGSYLEGSAYIKWRSFREKEDSRYVGLVLPRFLLRQPYSPETAPVKEFNYREGVTGGQHGKYLWGNATFAFASNLVRSFADNGWCVQIRGPESGGRVDNLPIHEFDVGRGREAKIPTELLIPETREFEFANQGFIPLSCYKNSDFACFFSANSAQKPQEYQGNANATANARINARLPYIMLSSRLAHYLKIIHRQNIGKLKNASTLQDELNNWLKELVTEMKNPSPEVAARRPLSKGEVRVFELPDNPGYFKVTMAVSPHFQVEGVDVNLQLVSHMSRPA